MEAHVRTRHRPPREEILPETRQARLSAMAVICFGGVIMLLATALAAVPVAVVGLVVLLAGLFAAASTRCS